VKTAASHANPTHLSAAEACGSVVSSDQTQLEKRRRGAPRETGFGNGYEGEKYDENEPIGGET
jgi:hypothetical protein